MLLFNILCAHKGATLKYIPKEAADKTFIVYCPKCHRYGKISLTDNDEIGQVKWSKNPGDLSKFKYVLNERGDDFGLQFNV